MTEAFFDFKNLDEDALRTHQEDIMEVYREVYDAIVAVTGPRTFENTVRPMIVTETLLQAKEKSFTIAKNFYPDKDVRDVATALSKHLKEFYIDCSMRMDVYGAFNSYYTTTYPEEKSSLTAEEQRYVEDHMRAFRRLGLHLSEPDRAELTTMRKELSDISIKFSTNINEVNTSFEFTREELNGMPDYWFSQDKLLENGKYRVTLKYPDYFPLMEYANSSDVRRQMYLAFNNRCGVENMPLLARAVKLRYFIAKKLGYDTFADYATEEKIIKNAANALTFENRLNERLTEPFKKYRATVAEFANSYQKNPLGKENIDIWDYTYYNRVYQEHVCEFDNTILRQYFPLATVKKGLMDIYQRLLGLKFEVVATENKWHEEVELYSVSDSNSGEIIGYFYLDLHPRAGKYGHAAVFNFISGCDMNKIIGSDTRMPGIVAMACNFPKGGCISFDEVVTFFHEFGHIMHQLCSRPQLCAYDGFGVERDFVEAPSQFLEFFCYEAEPLNLMSGHEISGEKVPAEYIEKLDKYKKVSAAYDKKRQIMLGLFDLVIHTMKFNSLDDDLNVQKVWNDNMDRVLGYNTGANTNFPASFGHLFGYEAGYYGYLLTETYAANMFYQKFDRANILDQGAGMQYRKKILEPGSTRDGIDLLKDFLGGEPDEKYFLIDNGLL